MNEIVLNNGAIIKAESYGDDSIWKSIDIVIYHRDGTSQTLCCIDYEYEGEKDILRALVFEDGNSDEPVFVKEYERGELG